MSEEKTALPVTSSEGPEPCPGQRFYQDVLHILYDRQVPHAVSGAIALREHTGVGRPVKDLDIFLTSSSAVAALRALRQSGFRCEICDPIWLAKAHRGEHFVDFITGMSNAAISVTDCWIDHAQPGDVFGIPTRILAAEELLASKLFVVRRERFDGSDIAHIIYGTGGRLDWARILNLAGAHWEMLLWSLLLFRYVYPAQSHFVPFPVWTQLLNRLMFRLSHPEPSARFRGSLVDENMFAIDVNEWGLDDLLSEYRSCRAGKIEWPGSESVGRAV